LLKAAKFQYEKKKQKEAERRGIHILGLPVKKKGGGGLRSQQRRTDAAKEKGEKFKVCHPERAEPVWEGEG